jgi:hypothetical protein
LYTFSLICLCTSSSCICAGEIHTLVKANHNARYGQKSFALQCVAFLSYREKCHVLKSAFYVMFQRFVELIAFGKYIRISTYAFCKVIFIEHSNI